VEKITSILVTARNDNELNNILTAISAQDDLRIVGVENDETGTIIKSERLKPDVLIMDLQPPGMDGSDLVPIIHRRSPSTAIIMMCDRDENDYATKAFRAGISGFMLRETDINRLIPAVKIVILGGLYVSPSIILRALGSFAISSQFPGQVIELNRQFGYEEKLYFYTPTERGIILGIAKGYTDDEIANNLNLSTGTIKNNITVIKRKTKMKTRTQIVLFSIATGLIKLEQLDIPNTWYYQNGVFH
jgi:DNA-binding NarL/FixJ family response regulator